MDDGRRSKADEDTYMDQETINEHLLQFRDETKSEMAEMKAQLSVIISLLQDVYNDEEAKPILLTPPASPTEEIPVCNYFDTSSKTTVEADDVLKVNEVADSHEMQDLEDETGCESTKRDYMIEYDSQLIPILDSTGIVSCEITIKRSINGENQQNEESAGVGLGQMDDRKYAFKVFADMPEPILRENLLDIEVEKADHKLLDERPVLSSVAWDGDFNGKKDSLSPYSYIIESGSNVDGSSWISGLLIGLSKVITQDVSYVDDMLGVSVTNSQSLSKLGFNLQVFDPGTLGFFKQEEYVSQLSANEISSELFLVYSPMYGEFSSYSHTVIEFCRCLFEWARSWNGKIDWVLRLCISQELLSWTCSSLLWSCNIAGDDISISSNNINTLPHDVWSNRPFIDFCFGALPHICTTFQAATGITNGHYMFIRNSAVYVTTVSLLIQRLPFEYSGKSILDLAIEAHPSHALLVSNKFGYQNDIWPKVMHHNTLLSEGLRPTQAWARQSNTNVVGFNFNNLMLVDSGGDGKYALRYSYSGDVVPPLFGKAHGTGIKAITGVVFSLRHVYSKMFIKFLYCCSLSLEELTNELNLVTSFGSWIGLLSPLRTDIAWDPGICAISIHILEDKDDFKRVGNRIVAMAMIRSIRDGQIKIRHQAMNEKWCFLVEVLDKFGLYMLVIATDYVIRKFRGPNSVGNAVQFGSVQTIMCNGVDLNFQIKQGWSTGCLDKATWNPFPIFQMSMKDVLIEGLLSPCSRFKHVRAHKVSLTSKCVMLLFWFCIVCCSWSINGDKQDWGFWFGDKVPNAYPTSASVTSYMYGLVNTFNLVNLWKALVFADATMSRVFVMELFPINCDSYSLWQHYSKMITRFSPISSQFVKVGQTLYINIVHFQDTCWRLAEHMLDTQKTRISVHSMRNLKLQGGAVLCNKYPGSRDPLISPLHYHDTESNNFFQPVTFEGIVIFETNMTSLHTMLTECCVSTSRLELGSIHFF